MRRLKVILMALASAFRHVVTTCPHRADTLRDILVIEVYIGSTTYLSSQINKMKEIKNRNKIKDTELHCRS